MRQSYIVFNSNDNFLSDGNASGNTNFGATSPVLGVTWHANDSLNLYANYGKGFESPTLAESAYSTGTNAVVGKFNSQLQASSSKHYEIGAKWIPQKRTRLDFAVYQIDTTDEIVVAVSSSGQTSYINAPGTSRTGWELSAAAQVSDHISASLSASSIDAKYSQTFSTGSVVKGKLVSNPAVNSGNKIPGIPESSTFAEIAWTSELFTNKSKAPLGGWRQLPWPVNDNYVGRLEAYTGRVREAGLPLDLRTQIEGSKHARQENHGPPSAQVQTTPQQAQPSSFCRQSRHQ